MNRVFPPGRDLRRRRRAERKSLPSGRYLAGVVDEIGEAARVVVLGTDALRVDFEREYVAIGHRPDRIVDVSPHETLDREAVLARLAAIPA